MNKLEAMRAFIEVANCGSFVGASRNLDMSPPAVTRTVAQLEQLLGVQLLQRTTRRVRLTEAGEHYLDDARRILDEVELAEATASGVYSEPRGVLSITAPVQFGQLHVLPIVAAYMSANPRVTIKAMFFDRISNLLDEGLDVALRIGSLKDSSLFAVAVGNVRRVVCASPDYLAKHGTPSIPAELKNHEVVLATTVDASSSWRFNTSQGKELIRVSPRLHCNQVGAAVQAAVNGCGIARLMSYQVGEEIKKGRLIRILQPYESEPIPVSLVYLSGRKANAKVRSFVDFAVERLRANPYIEH